MAYLHDPHDEACVLDRVDDAVVALPDAGVLPAVELLAAVRSRVLGELADALDHLAAIVERDRLDLSGGGELDLDRIGDAA